MHRMWSSKSINASHDLNCLCILQVSYKLRQLAKSGGPDGDELKELAMAVENFAINLIEPLKSDDMKRAIFEGKDFDRVADIAVKYEQKKVLEKQRRQFNKT